MCGAKHLHIMLPHVHAVEGLNGEVMIYSESARSVLVTHSLLGILMLPALSYSRGLWRNELHRRQPSLVTIHDEYAYSIRIRADTCRTMTV